LVDCAVSDAAIESRHGDAAADAVCARIVQRLAHAGVPRVQVQPGAAGDGDDGHGGFAVRTAYGGVKLYLPQEVLAAYTRDHAARQTVDDAITGIVECLRRP
jgi:hypothetical protein